MNKPREFWILEDTQNNVLCAVSDKIMTSDAKHSVHHVVHKSAYSKIKAKNIDLEKENKIMKIKSKINKNGI